MVDLMCLHQAYERHEITEVKWISSGNNPANAITKAKPCQALKTLINTNRLNLKIIKVKQISSGNNLVDAMTKVKLYQALKTLINTNKLNLKVINQVKQD